MSVVRRHTQKVNPRSRSRTPDDNTDATSSDDRQTPSQRIENKCLEIVAMNETGIKPPPRPRYDTGAMVALVNAEARGKSALVKSPPHTDHCVAKVLKKKVMELHASTQEYGTGSRTVPKRSSIPVQRLIRSPSKRPRLQLRSGLSSRASPQRTAKDRNRAVRVGSLLLIPRLNPQSIFQLDLEAMMMMTRQMKRTFRRCL